jgi:hypothetical protein
MSEKFGATLLFSALKQVLGLKEEDPLTAFVLFVFVLVVAFSLLYIFFKAHSKKDIKFYIQFFLVVCIALSVGILIR